MKQQSLHSEILSYFQANQANQSLLLLLNAVCLQIPIL